MDGAEPIKRDFNWGAKFAIGFTFGRTNKNIMFSLLATYTSQGNRLNIGKFQTKKFSHEHTFGFMGMMFRETNDYRLKYKKTGMGFIITGSSMLGGGGNTNMAGSNIMSTPISMFNSQGDSGFSGGGVGWTSINFISPRKLRPLSNNSWNALGRFTTKSGNSFSVNLMEDVPWTDHGNSGSLYLSYVKDLGNNNSVAFNFSSETFTDVALERSYNDRLKNADFSDPSTNKIKGYRNYSLMKIGVPNYGTKYFSVNLSTPFSNTTFKLGQMGGLLGALDQNSIHTKLGDLWDYASTPTFPMDTRKFFNTYNICVQALGGFSPNQFANLSKN